MTSPVVAPSRPAGGIGISLGAPSPRIVPARPVLIANICSRWQLIAERRQSFINLQEASRYTQGKSLHALVARQPARLGTAAS